MENVGNEEEKPVESGDVASDEEYPPYDETRPAFKRRIGCSRLSLYIIGFIILENLIIPPRFQVSNNIALGVIWVYQHTASPLFRETGFVRCRFYPSCSEYTRLSLLHCGFIHGAIMGGWRILRCNPYNHGPHEDWPYEGAWKICNQMPPDYLPLPPDVHTPLDKGD
jgi:putative component of membrane protein insertase Oxa1/YidC/SpoIIIJ protein YidD